MSNQGKHPLSSDEMLVAYLDGQLTLEEQQSIADLVEKDDRLAQRLEFLSAGTPSFRSAFDALLDEAPTSRMAKDFERAFPPVVQTAGYSRRHLIAAAITSIAIGIGGGIGVDRLVSKNPAEDEGWRSVVANYMGLYSTATLSSFAQDPDTLNQQFESVSLVLGMPLHRADVNMPGLELKRAQILQFNGKPLGQFAFLDANHQPLAFCVIANTSGEAQPQTERRRAMNIVFWANDTHSFLVIGHLPLETMENVADRFRGVLPA